MLKINLPNIDLFASVSATRFFSADISSSQNDTMPDLPLCGCATCRGESPHPVSDLLNSDNSSSPLALIVPSSSPYYVKALDSGNVWSNNGNGVTITYKFWDALPSHYSSGSTEANNFQSFTSSQKVATLKILDMLSSIANVTFVETSSDSSAKLGFASANLGSGVGAWAYYPGSSAKSGDVWMNNAYSATKTVTEGSYGFMVLAHEIGHAMGLSHSFDHTPSLTGAEDSSRWTIMSYTWPFYSESYMIYDIAALQAKYGANMNYATGNDNYVLKSGHAYAIWDAGGTDTLDGSALTSPMTLNLNAGTMSSVGKTQNIGIAFNVTIENAKGGSGADKIYGNDASNHIWGNNGNDKLYGSAGNDTLDGGTGTDTVIYTYNISEFLISLVNSITVTLAHTLLGLDTLINVEKFTFGSSTYDFDDLQNYTGGGDPGGGNDGGGNDDDDSNSGTINGDDGPDTLTGTVGDDVMYGHGGYDKMYGGGGNDEIHGGDYTDRLYGEEGNDTLYGDEGSGYLYGGNGKDILHGGSYYDRIYGEDGDDTLNGNGGNDYLYGGTGNDILNGGSGNDRIHGDAGNDTITGGTGNDYLYGDAGNDTVIYQYDIQDFLITVYSSYTKVTHDLLGADTLFNFENFQFGDTVYTLSDLESYLNGDNDDPDDGDDTGDSDEGDSGGDTTIHGTDGYDTIHGGNGNDVIYGYGSYDKLYGGGGDDEIHGGDYLDKLYGAAGNDTLYGDDGNDYLYGGDGNDALHGGNGADRLYGDGGNDTLNGNSGNDYLYGKDGNDTLRGGDGNDYLYGDNGDDILIAGLGRDTLYGRSGSDVFAFDAIDNETDYIRDFTLNGSEADKLNITDIISGFDGSQDINDFVRLDVAGSSRMYLEVNQDGSGSDWTTVASITGSNFSNATLENLIASGQLITGESLL